MQTVNYIFQENRPLKGMRSNRYIGTFRHGKGLAAAAFYENEVCVWPSVYDATGPGPTPDIRIPACGDAEAFRATFLAAVNACLIISEACALYAAAKEAA